MFRCGSAAHTLTERPLPKRLVTSGQAHHSLLRDGGDVLHIQTRKASQLCHSELRDQHNVVQRTAPFFCVLGGLLGFSISGVTSICCYASVRCSDAIPPQTRLPRGRQALAGATEVVGASASLLLLLCRKPQAKNAI